MTREENLHWIDQEIQTWENECQSKHPIKEALYAARKALEQEPCEDVVSRAEVKKIVKEMYLEVASMELDAKTISDCISCTSSKCREVLERKLQALPPVTPQEPRWIPVTEKRPVEFEKVLVTYKLHYDNSIHVGIGNIITNVVNGRYHWNINEQDYIGWDMLAWMPLPEPYEGGE